MYNVFKSLLTELGNALGLSEINVENDSSLLEFDERKVSFFWIEKASSLTLFTTVCPLPETNQEANLKKLLCANTFFAETGGFTLGLMKDTGVTLQYSATANALQGNMLTVVENFVNMAEHWKNELQHETQNSTASYQDYTATGFTHI